MDPAHYVLLTTEALKAARDCGSKKTKRRLKAAMNAVLADNFKEMTEETQLMAAVAGTIKVIDDASAENLQKELYGLGRLSSLMQQCAPDNPDPADVALIEKDMPDARDLVGVLVLWELVRNSHGLYRAADDALGDIGTIDLPPGK